jgi:glycosyltransferase involved in cell wall biosynthesis
MTVCWRNDSGAAMRIGVVIPALNEELNITAAVSSCCELASDLDEVRVVVCDNGSTDRTSTAAQSAGAEVVVETQRGYGAACAKAIEHLGSWPDVLLFCDADAGTTIDELHRLLLPLRQGAADLVLGARTHAESGAMNLPQRFGNWLALTLIRIGWSRHFLDVGPLRAIRRESFQRLGMTDRTWGWTVEMQIRAVRAGLSIHEVDVGWRRRRHGKSKISGTVWGVVRTGFRILWTIGRLYFKRRDPIPATAVILPKGTK